MGKKLYVGNLPYSIGSSDLEQMFSQFGQVQSAQVIEDRETGRSKGFGFVEWVPIRTLKRRSPTQRPGSRRSPLDRK